MCPGCYGGLQFPEDYRKGISKKEVSEDQVVISKADYEKFQQMASNFQNTQIS